MAEAKEIECRVTGRVQLVMYRDFAQRKARGLGLSGTVENLPDGSVRVIAQGGEEDLKKLIEHLRRGPLLARVDGVSVLWREPLRQFQDFAIIY